MQLLTPGGRLRKHIRAADLEAAGKQRKQPAPNSRKLDEGDLFGIRAIESGYFGGVAQSRPTSAAGIHSRSGSFSHTSLGSRPSPKILSTLPSGSVVNLPMGSRRCSSPLAKYVIFRTDDDLEPSHSKRTQPEPVNSRLGPSSAGYSARTKRDPAVHMSWNVPPSPTSDTSLVSDSSSGNNGLHSPSSSHQTPQKAEHGHIATSTSRVTWTEDTKGSAHHGPTSRTLAHDFKPQSTHITSPDLVGARFSSGQRREAPPNIVITNPPQVPRRAATAVKLIHPAKPVSAIRDVETSSMLHRAGGSSGQL